MMRKKIVLFAAAFAAVLAAQPAVAGDEKLGQKVFRKCKACHAVGESAKNKIGPQLNDLFGRTAGSLEGYKYSKAMLAKGTEGLVWDEESLTGFLNKPKKYLPGTKMSFGGIRKPADMENLLAYLKLFSGSN